MSIQTFSRFFSASPIPKAVGCIIGNEILTGKIQDSNSNFLARTCFSFGIFLQRLVFIRDDIEEIVSNIRELSSMVGQKGFIVTSGGIGPTHDDITYEGVAKAFNLTLSFHHPTFQKMKSFYEMKNIEINESRKKMVYLPDAYLSTSIISLANHFVDCETITLSDIWTPIVKVQNVYILPGIPSLFEKMLPAVCQLYSSTPQYRVILRMHKLEGEIASFLSDISKKYPQVSIGSYPNWDGLSDPSSTSTFQNTRKNTLALSFEGDKVLVNEVVEYVKSNIHDCWIDTII